MQQNKNQGAHQLNSNEPNRRFRNSAGPPRPSCSVWLIQHEASGTTGKSLSLQRISHTRHQPCYDLQTSYFSVARGMHMKSYFPFVFPLVRGEALVRWAGCWFSSTETLPSCNSWNKHKMVWGAIVDNKSWQSFSLRIHSLFFDSLPVQESLCCSLEKMCSVCMVSNHVV